MKRWCAIAAIILIAGLTWVISGETSPYIIPFRIIETIQPFSSSANSAGLFLHKPEGGYATVRFDLQGMHSLLTSAAALGSLLTDPGSFVDAPAGPDGVGRAGQWGAGGRFTSSGGLGGVHLPFYGSSVNVYLGTSGFFYTGLAHYEVGPGLTSVIAEDFNGDGVDDLAVSFEGDYGQTAAPGGLGILINQGDGTFAPVMIYTAGMHPSSVAALDLNHDNRLDLAVADSGSGPLYVLMGNGDGTFANAASYATGLDGHLSVTIADLNGDGNADLAASSQDQVSLLFGNGDGSFGASQEFPSGQGPNWYIAAGDLNGDGALDLVTANYFRALAVVMLNNGSGHFQGAGSYAIGYSADSLVLTDVDQDGNLDIVNGTGDARWFGPSVQSIATSIVYGRGDGTFNGVAAVNLKNGVSLLAAADFDGDGKTDVITSGNSDNLAYFHGATGGALQVEPQEIPLPNGASGGVTGDFNGDQRPDLAVYSGYSQGTVSVLLGNGSGFQSPTQTSSGGNQPSGMVTADFDGNGSLDLAVINTDPGNIVILKGGGNGSFTLKNTYTVPAAQALATADFTGDGLPDLAVTEGISGGNGSVHLFRNTGGGAFAAMTPLILGESTNNLTFADVDGDGLQDLVASINGANFTWQIAVLKGAGGGSFADPELLNSDFGPGSLAVQDFDSDGNPDIVVTHCCGQTVPGYYRGISGGNFAPERLFPGGVSPKSVAAAHLDATAPESAPLDLIIGTSEGSILTMPNIHAAFRNRNSASFLAGELAPDMIATGEVADVAPSLVMASTNPWPEELGGVRAEITDSSGATLSMPLYYAATNSASYLIPAATKPGSARIALHTASGATVTEAVSIKLVAPGLYSADSSGSGAAAAFFLRVAGDGSRTQDYIFDVNTRQPVDISLGEASDQIYLILYGTGFRHATEITATVGGRSVPVLGAAAHSVYQGLDQVNIGPLPRNLAGAGLVNIQLVFDGIPANVVTMKVQ